MTASQSNVHTTKLHRKPRGDSSQHPKFPKARANKQHKHQLRDDHGAYTLVGRDPIYADATGRPMRRIWLAGISAQQGY